MEMFFFFTNLGGGGVGGPGLSRKEERTNVSTFFSNSYISRYQDLDHPVGQLTTLPIVKWPVGPKVIPGIPA